MGQYKITPRKHVFLGWQPYTVTDRGAVEPVGPRIWQLAKAKDFAEMIWRMSRG